MLCGGHGRSLNSNRFAFTSRGPRSLRGPSIVDNSPTEKLSIVDQTTLAPHKSVIVKPWKLAYMDGEVLMILLFNIDRPFLWLETHNVKPPETTVLIGKPSTWVVGVGQIKECARLWTDAYELGLD